MTEILPSSVVITEWFSPFPWVNTPQRIDFVMHVWDILTPQWKHLLFREFNSNWLISDAFNAFNGINDLIAQKDKSIFVQKIQQNDISIATYRQRIMYFLDTILTWDNIQETVSDVDIRLFKNKALEYILQVWGISISEFDDIREKSNSVIRRLRTALKKNWELPHGVFLREFQNLRNILFSDVVILSHLEKVN